MRVDIRPSSNTNNIYFFAKFQSKLNQRPYLFLDDTQVYKINVITIFKNIKIPTHRVLCISAFDMCSVLLK